MVINRLIDSSLWLVFCILLNVQVFRQSDGPAIWGGCVPPAGGWRTFCRHGTDFIEHYACRTEGPDRSAGWRRASGVKV
jgi:hypothetical protein